MKVILLKDVKSQGRKDDIINVSDGYANNYLIKNKLAVAYTETSKKILHKQIQIGHDEEAKIVANLNEIKNKLNDKIINSNLLFNPRENITIKTAKLGNDAGIIGASKLLMWEKINKKLSKSIDKYFV